MAFVGAVTGYMAKPKGLEEKLPKERLKLFILGVATSMFISYVTYEIAMFFFDRNGMAVALAGLASFIGTDFAVALEKGILNFIERKFKNL